MRHRFFSNIKEQHKDYLIFLKTNNFFALKYLETIEKTIELLIDLLDEGADDEVDFLFITALSFYDSILRIIPRHIFLKFDDNYTKFNVPSQKTFNYLILYATMDWVYHFTFQIIKDVDGNQEMLLQEKLPETLSGFNKITKLYLEDDYLNEEELFKHYETIVLEGQKNNLNTWSPYFKINDFIKKEFGEDEVFYVK